MTRLYKFVLAAFIIHFSAIARAEDISGLVRDLNTLQNRIAVGDAKARDAVAQKFDVIEKLIANSGAEIWLEEKNIRAIIIYFLCGGAAQNIGKLADVHPTDSRLEMALRASLLYAEGKEGGAPKDILQIDPRYFPQMLTGHLALVQAGALIGKDNARAIALLDLARLVMPGSLVEEAALRREISVLNPVTEVDKLALLSSRYVSLYLKSPYAKNFWEAFQHVTIETPGFGSRFQKFLSILDKASPEMRANVNLELAREALMAGKFDGAQEAIERAAIGVDGEALRRVNMYKVVLAALKENQSVEALKKIDPASMKKGDAALLLMASSVVSALSARNGKSTDSADEAYEMVSIMRRAIRDSDELLKRAENR